MSKPHLNLPFDSGYTVGSVVFIRSEAWMFLLCLRPRPQSHRNVNCNFFTCSKVSGWLHRKRQHFTCSKVSGWLRRILQHFTCSKVSGCARGGFGGRGRFSRNPASYSGAPGGWPPNAAGRTGRVRERLVRLRCVWASIFKITALEAPAFPLQFVYYRRCC